MAKKDEPEKDGQPQKERPEAKPADDAGDEPEGHPLHEYTPPQPKEGTPGVYAKLHRAQYLVQGVLRTGHNKHFDYKFVQEPHVLEACRRALNEAGLVFGYSVKRLRERTVTTRNGNEEVVAYLWLLFEVTDPEDGSTHRWTFIGQGQDGMDKGLNKALVAGVKYGLLKALMVPTGDDAEDSANDERTGGGNQPRQRRRSGPPDVPEQQFKCPKCGGPMWDNRADERSTRQGGKRPNFKCRNKACDEALFGYHPDEPREETAGAQGQSAPVDPALEELKGLNKGQLVERWEAELAGENLHPRHPCVMAYALVDEQVRDESGNWTKEHYVRALSQAIKKGGVGKLVVGAANYLSEKQPAPMEDLEELKRMLDTQEVLNDEDAQWYRDCLETTAAPLVTKALVLLRGLLPVEQRTTSGQKDDLPF